MKTDPPLVSAKDYIWDAMAEGRNLKVEYLTADDATASYRVSFDLVLGRDKQHAMSRLGGFKKNGVRKLIAKYAQFGLKLFFSDDDMPRPPSSVQANGADALPASI